MMDQQQHETSETSQTPNSSVRSVGRVLGCGFKSLGRALNTLRRIATTMLLTIAIIWLVMSHTVLWAADFTTAVIRTLGMTITASSDIRTELAMEKDLRLAVQSELEETRHQLNRSEQRAVQLHSEVDSTRSRLTDAQAEVERNRTRLRDTELELSNQRSHIARLETDVVNERRIANGLRVENIMLEAQGHVTLNGRRVHVREAAEATIGRVQRRTAQVTTANVASVWGEAIPVYGIAVIVAATSFELSMACLDMQDLYDLQVALDPESAVPTGRDAVCGLQVPTQQEVLEKIKASPGWAWEQARFGLRTGADGLGSIADAAQERISDLELPDFSRRWQRTISGVSDWFD